MLELVAKETVEVSQRNVLCARTRTSGILCSPTSRQPLRPCVHIQGMACVIVIGGLMHSPGKGVIPSDQNNSRSGERSTIPNDWNE
jgi:hypothetical protein